MTRMHFQAVAGIVAQTFGNALSNPDISEEEFKALKQTQAILVDNLAMRFAYFNPNFNARKFIDACYQK